MNRRISVFLLLFTLGTNLSRAEDVTLDQAKAAFAKADATLNATYQRAKTSMAEWSLTWATASAYFLTSSRSR